MSKRTDRNLIVGLDIGTSKVVALVAEFKADGELEVMPLDGQTMARRGFVIIAAAADIEAIARCLEAELARAPEGAPR